MVSPSSFKLDIIHLEISVGSSMDEVAKFVPDVFYYTSNDFNKNRSKYRNDYVMMDKIREDYYSKSCKFGHAKDEKEQSKRDKRGPN